MTIEIVAIIAMLFCFGVVVLMFLDRRMTIRHHRDMIAYMKARSAYEAEDAIDRNEGRTQGTIRKVLASKKKKAEDLVEPGTLDTLAEKVRSEAAKAYDQE